MVEMSGYAILRVYYSIDGGEYELADSILNSGFYSYPAVIKPRRCNSFKIKFEGFGDVKIHPMTRKMFVGSSVAPMGERALDWSQDENMSWDQLESFTWNELNHRRDP
jgi:hypothetical protein